MKRTWVLVLFVIAMISSVHAAAMPDADTYSTCQFSSDSEQATPDFTPACPSPPYRSCGLGLCKVSDDPPIYEAMELIRIHCAAVDQGYDRCMLAPQVQFGCGEGNTVWYETCDCACPDGTVKKPGYYRRMFCG